MSDFTIMLISPKKSFIGNKKNTIVFEDKKEMIDAVNRYITNEDCKLTDIDMNGYNMVVKLYKKTA